MKLHKLAIWTLAALTLASSCDDIDNQEPAGGNLTADQSKETNDEIPSRTSAAFAGMFSYLGAPDGVLKQDRADDFGFIMAALSLDLEGADMTSSNNGYSGDLEIALIPEWFRTEILKEELDNNGVLIENANITELEKFALLFEFDGDVRSIRHVLYNCTSSRPSIESETKEDTIEPGKEKLTLTADPREDGLVKSRTGDETDAETYKNWYQQVYVPAPKTEG